jgi:hypothetical protein
VTTTVKVYEPAVVGVQENIPLVALILAPLGAFRRLYVIV